MDTNVKKIRPRDLELSQVQDNLAGVIQQLLDLANGTAAPTLKLTPVMDQPRGAGTPMVVKTPGLLVEGRPDGPFVFLQPTVQFGEPTWQPVNGAVIPQMDAEVITYGQAIFIGSTTQSDGFVIIPQSPGPTFRIANVGNTQTNLQVDSSGNVFTTGTLTVSGKTTLGAETTIKSALNVDATVNAAGMASGQGFKNSVCVGSYYNTGYGANNIVQLGVSVQNQATLGGMAIMPFAMKWTHSGSIVGMTLFQNGSVAGLNSLLIYKNGTLTYTWAAGSGAAGATYWVQFPKVTTGLTFLAGDTMTASYRCATGGTAQVLAHLTLEMAA